MMTESTESTESTEDPEACAARRDFPSIAEATRVWLRIGYSACLSLLR